MDIRIGEIYYFDNTRATPAIKLRVTGETEFVYFCDYLDNYDDVVSSGKFRKKGAFCHDLRSWTDAEFYLVWVPGGPTPITKRHRTLGSAKRACEYLLHIRHVKEAFIMKRIGTASSSLSVDFSMDEED